MEKIKKILDDIKISKGIQRKKGEYSEKVAKEVWLGIAKKYIGSVKVGEDAKKVWSELIKYAFAHEECIYDLNKGIGLIGQTGSGKTITMDILNDFISVDDIIYIRDGQLAHFKFKIISAKVIGARFSEKGFEIITKYSSMGNLCIDDLGSENLVSKYYGESVNVIEEIIENRYSKNLITHFTSNLDSNDILKTYGDRVYSRLMHSCNIITLNDEDYRIK